MKFEEWIDDNFPCTAKDAWDAAVAIHHDEVVEKCAVVCDVCAVETDNTNNTASWLASSIRELKLKVVMPLPPIGKFFRTNATWYSYSTDGDSSKHGPDDIIAVRTGEDDYSFVHPGQGYLYESLGEFTEWELI